MLNEKRERGKQKIFTKEGKWQVEKKTYETGEQASSKYLRKRKKVYIKYLTNDGKRQVWLTTTGIVHDYADAANTLLQ